MAEVLGRLELEDLLADLRERAGEVLATQRRLRKLLGEVRSLSSGLSVEHALDALVLAACELLDADQARFDVVSTEFPGRRHYVHGDDPADATWLQVELTVRSRIFGSLSVGCSGQLSSHASVEITQVMRTLTAAAAISVQNAISYETLASRRAWTTASAEITEALLAVGRDLDSALQLISQRSVELAQAQYVVVGLVDEDHIHIRVGAGEGLPPGLVGARYPIKGSLSGHAISSRDVVLSDNPSRDPRAWSGSPATTYVAIVPLAPPLGEPFGIISVTYPEGRGTPSDSDLDMLKGFAVQAALAREFSRAQQDRTQLAVFEDRDRIGRELHDLVIQRVFAIGMSVQSVTRLVDAEKGQRLVRIVEELDATIRDLRETVFQLDQAEHSEDLLVELKSAVREIAGERISMIDVEVVGDGSVVPHDFRAPLIAVARESLSNALRHAQASSITVAFVIDDHVTVIVADDGIGIPEVQTRRSGTGNLEQRARSLGGEFSLRNRPDGGAVARWSVPMPRG